MYSSLCQTLLTARSVHFHYAVAQSNRTKVNIAKLISKINENDLKSWGFMMPKYMFHKKAVLSVDSD